MIPERDPKESQRLPGSGNTDFLSEPRKGRCPQRPRHLKELSDNESTPSLGSPHPSRIEIFLRGARGQCPRCTETNLFKDSYRMREACPGCGLAMEKEDGWSFGAVPLNYTLTCMVWVLPIALLVLPGWLSVKTAAIVAGSGVLVLPWLTYRYSKKVWLGLYYAVLCDEVRQKPEDA